jgi:PadR family transcriptional regulator, regulatory protein AphA
VSIKYVILGFLSDTPLTGYDLKKKFSESSIFHWTGNNNQIYRTLVELHEENLVTIEVQYQESKPPRKIYTITAAGLAALRQWMLTAPELPHFRNPLLMQLTWADQLEPDALKQMLAAYEEELQVHLLILREQTRRNNELAPQNHFFGERIAEHWISFYELERSWVKTLRKELDNR